MNINDGKLMKINNLKKRKNFASKDSGATIID
jgi:hypothetical protein